MIRRPLIWGDSHALVAHHAWTLASVDVDTIVHVDAHSDLGQPLERVTDGNFLAHLSHKKAVSIYWIVPPAVFIEIQMHRSPMSTFAPWVQGEARLDAQGFQRAPLPNGRELVICPMSSYHQLDIGANSWFDLDVDFVSFGGADGDEHTFLLGHLGEWLDHAGVLSLAISVSCGTARLADLGFVGRLFERVAHRASYRFVSNESSSNLSYAEAIHRLHTLASELELDEERLANEAFFHSSPTYLDLTDKLLTGGVLENGPALTFRRIAVLVRMGRFLEAAAELQSMPHHGLEEDRSEMRNALADAVGFLKED